MQGAVDIGRGDEVAHSLALGNGGRADMAIGVVFVTSEYR